MMAGWLWPGVLAAFAAVSPSAVSTSKELG